MRAGNNVERTIVWTAIVEMKAQREHALQQGLGRRHMGHGSFHVPRAEAVHLDALLHRDGAILMPGHAPVRLRCLIEGEDAHHLGGAPR